ncbi:interleukin-1 receptor type 1-like isoform X1 [Salvelinus namaycush]|uniref:Interleukin-1 receptor type 1-like isoform X1 n=1 Tax=Salvelinus namaycush TaxID=8040 RepID=A0A8U1BZD2_SALNM|nr:interleukin-1 receptor type 1-like isoform X1 [Salvelinus namaycush]XP_038862912.1 interleukin-1 receptor type 1-like isoform X1 [Salvelinus namaycush]
MDWSQMLQIFLFSLLCLTGSSKAVGELCKDYGREFERVFSVPGDAAMLTSTLLAPNVFNYDTVPYNISWYDPRTGRKLTSETGKTLVQEKTLWMFNIEMDDAGDYVCVVRTPSQCYKQATLLIVNQNNPEECGRPQNEVEQVLTNTASAFLSCPLSDQIRKVDNYSIQWYKGCERIVEDDPLWDRFTYVSDGQRLLVAQVSPEDHGFYTCTMTFDLEGLSGRISETFVGTVKKDYCLVPKVVEPANKIIKADLGSSFSKMCRVFVLSVGGQCADLIWTARDDFIPENVSERVFQESQSEWREEEKKGVWIERQLNFLEVEEEDFYIDYTCQTWSDRGFYSASFTLQPTDPNYLLPIGVLLTSLVLMFTVSVVIYHRFKIDIVLSFRRMFPFLYTNTESDGKLYDAYVAYPHLSGSVASGEVEMFALHTLPQVLEGRCGYRLFILGRDSLPGEAVVDAVEESMWASRRLLLVYTGSTFCSGGQSDSSSSDVLEAWKSFERQMAMHRALLEGSLKVVLVELEEITPTQLAFFPESVRHLRERQGAVCWWKSSRTRRTRGLRCGRWGEEEVKEKRGELASPSFSSPSLSSSSHFWKELRYYMPVRGKRTKCPEKNSLLNI